MILYRIALIELEMTENNQNTLSLFEYKGKTPPEYTVTEVSNIIKRSIEDNFDFVRIRGEISGLKIAPSGHVYFSLKDKFQDDYDFWLLPEASGWPKTAHLHPLHTPVTSSQIATHSRQPRNVRHSNQEHRYFVWYPSPLCATMLVPFHHVPQQQPS